MMMMTNGHEEAQRWRSDKMEQLTSRHTALRRLLLEEEEEHEHERCTPQQKEEGDDEEKKEIMKRRMRREEEEEEEGPATDMRHQRQEVYSDAMFEKRPTRTTPLPTRLQINFVGSDARVQIRT